jgi:hypothetical protein
MYFYNTQKKDYNLSSLIAAKSQKLKVGDGCEIGKITSLMPFKLFVQHFLSRSKLQSLTLNKQFPTSYLCQLFSQFSFMHLVICICFHFYFSLSFFFVLLSGEKKFKIQKLKFSFCLAAFDNLIKGS